MWKKLNYIILVGVAISSVRMITGAFSVIYIINKGLSLSDIGMLKAIQAFIILFSDIPISYIADKHSRKFSICSSIFFSTIWLFVMVYANSFFFFALAEILNAISLSLLGGAFIAYLIDHQNTKKKDDIKIKVSHYHQWQFFFMGVSAFLGAAFTQINSSTVWFVSALLMFVVFILSLYLPDDRKPVNKRNVKFSFKGIKEKLFEEIINDFETLKILLNQKLLLKQIVLILVVSTFSYQVIIQYWQPFSFSSYDSLPKHGVFYGTLFMIILLVQSLGSLLVKHMDNRNARTIGNIIVASSVLVNLIGFFFLKELLFLGVILIFMGNRMTIVSLQSSFHSLIGSDLRSTLDSFISLLVRLVLLFLLPLIGVLLQNYGWLVIVFLFMLNALLIYKIIVED